MSESARLARARAPGVCTLVRGRRARLENLMHALAAQSLHPAELVIAYLQDDAFADLPEMPFPVREAFVAGEALPLAAGRNACARVASSPLLVFLDVDCLPDPGLVHAFASVTRRGDCVMGDVRYLTGDAPAPGEDFERDWCNAIPHPARAFSDRFGPGVHVLDDPGEFWSLCFAIARDTFRDCGGFDEGYVGYGGEDTDFGRALDRAGVTLAWCSRARAVHQWHRVQVPPLDHLHSILANAERFRRKHGRSCMEYWLAQFAEGGWIELGADGGTTLLREPSAHERELARRPLDVAFS